MNNNGLLSDDELKNVSGGATTDDQAFIDMKDEFDKAWGEAGMDKKGISGMQRGELFVKWESENKKGKKSAKEFLQSQKC